MTKNNALTTFNHPQFGSIRVITKDNEPWFVAKDVCDILGISNTGNAYARLDADEKCYIQRTDVGMNPGRSLMLISESGFYKLILRANSSPVATAFQNWVTREVLPAIRKDGMYVMGEEKVKTGEKSFEELTLMVVNGLQEKIARLAEEKAIAEAKVLELAPKASKYDRYLEADGTINITSAGKILGMSGVRLGQLLRQKGWLFKRTDAVVPKQPIIDRGLMVVKQHFTLAGVVVPQGRVTVKGMDALMDLFGF